MLLYLLENLVDYVTVMFCIVYQGEPRAGRSLTFILSVLLCWVYLFFKELFTSRLMKPQVIEFFFT